MTTAERLARFLNEVAREDAQALSILLGVSVACQPGRSSSTPAVSVLALLNAFLEGEDGGGLLVVQRTDSSALTFGVWRR